MVEFEDQKRQLERSKEKLELLKKQANAKQYLKFIRNIIRTQSNTTNCSDLAHKIAASAQQLAGGGRAESACAQNFILHQTVQ